MPVQPLLTKPAAPPIWFLALCTAISVVGLTILTPILPMMAESLGVSDAAVQSLLTAYLIAIAVGQLVCGPISDRFGRRPVMLVGTILYCLGGLATSLTADIDFLTLWRVVQGLGAAACMSMGRAIVNDVYERSEAARQMSTISMVLAIAPALSMVFGGIIADAAGWQATMALLSGTGALAFFATWTLVTETNQHPVTAVSLRSLFSAYRSVLSNSLFVYWTITSGMQIGVFFVLNGVLAYQYARHGYSMAEFGLWFALTPLSYLIGNSFNRSWFVARGIERAAFIGCSLSLVSMLAMLFTQELGLTHALSLALPCAVFGFSNGIIVANTTVGAISALSRHAGTGSGIVGAWQMATGGIAGAIIVALGGAQNFTIAASALVIMCVISVLSMLKVFLMMRKSSSN
ncbi:multidrug effflux MFS transporter [bacterium]|nr:multidrug effflux MFS transporter [bacterium]